MLRIVYADCCKLTYYAECHYAECRYAECHYAECCGALVSLKCYNICELNVHTFLVSALKGQTNLNSEKIKETANLSMIYIYKG